MDEPKRTPTEPQGIAVTRAIAVLLDQAASVGIRAQRETGAYAEAMLGAQALALCHDAVALLPDRLFPDAAPPPPGRSAMALVQEAYRLAGTLPVQRFPPGMPGLIAALRDTVGDHA